MQSELFKKRKSSQQQAHNDGAQHGDECTAMEIFAEAAVAIYKMGEHYF